jgi:hypothetical protein
MVLINWKDIDYQIRVKSVFLAVKPLPKRKFIVKFKLEVYV